MAGSASARARHPGEVLPPAGRAARRGAGRTPSSTGGRGPPARSSARCIVDEAASGHPTIQLRQPGHHVGHHPRVRPDAEVDVPRTGRLERARPPCRSGRGTDGRSSSQARLSPVSRCASDRSSGSCSCSAIAISSLGDRMHPFEVGPHHVEVGQAAEPGEPLPVVVGGGRLLQRIADHALGLRRVPAHGQLRADDVHAHHELVPTAVRRVGGRGQALEEVVAELDRRSVVAPRRRSSPTAARAGRSAVRRRPDQPTRPTPPACSRARPTAPTGRRRAPANVSCLWRPDATSL